MVFNKVFVIFFFYILCSFQISSSFFFFFFFPRRSSAGKWLSSYDRNNADRGTLGGAGYVRRRPIIAEKLIITSHWFLFVEHYAAETNRLNHEWQWSGHTTYTNRGECMDRFILYCFTRINTTKLQCVFDGRPWIMIDPSWSASHQIECSPFACIFHSVTNRWPLDIAKNAWKVRLMWDTTRPPRQ